MLDVIREWQGLLALAATFALGGLGWALRAEVRQMISDRASVAQVEVLAARLTELDRRVLAAEHTIDSRPTDDQLNRLALRIESLAGDVRTTLAQLSGTNEMLRGHARKLDLVEDFLRRQSS